MKPKISVIVPVYNTESYLERCLDSLINQTFKEIEIIIVNDGSTDNSNKIIQKYERKYEGKVISLYIENKGPGEARNFGIKYASGKYVGFIDSDDWIDSKMYEKLYNKAICGYDIVICDCIELFNEKYKYFVQGFKGPVFDYKNIIMYSTDPAFVCNKLILRDPFKIIKFPQYWYEDLATIPVLMSYCNRIGYVEEALYYYAHREKSITYSEDEKTLGVLEAWKRILQDSNAQCKDEIIFSVCRSIGVFLEFKPMYSDKFIKFIKENKSMIESNKYYIEAVKDGKIRDLLSLI